MYNKGDRVVLTISTWRNIRNGTVGTVVHDVPDDQTPVRWDHYTGYLSDNDYHWMPPYEIQLYHQEVPYDPEQMLVEEDDL